jgi:transposase
MLAAGRRVLRIANFEFWRRRGWVFSSCPVVEALQPLRGMELISAATFLTEIGGLSRFPSPYELMAYLGLVLSEHSTGDKCGAVTKAMYIRQSTMGREPTPPVCAG